MESYEKMFDTICRVCLSYGNSENMVSLLDNTSKDGLSCYGKSITILTNISMKGENLPYKMCQICLFRLKQAIIFKKTCENSDQKLSCLVKKHSSLSPGFKEKICDYILLTDSIPDKLIFKGVEKPSKKKNSIKFKEKRQKEVKNVSGINNLHNEFEDLFDLNNCDTIDNAITSPIESEVEDDQTLDKLDQLVKMSPKSLNACLKKYPKKKHKFKKVKKENVTNNWNKIQQCTVNKLQEKKLMCMSRRKNISNDNNHPKIFQCDTCKKVLSSRCALKVHLSRHEGGKFICELCGKIYPSNGELKYHLAYTHNIGRQFSCKECDYKAPKMHELIEHERIHTGERPYACDQCGLTFRRQYIWKKHALFHKEKTVQCPRCPKKFYQRRDIIEHINSAHERLYVFACSQCDVTYAKLASVRRHLIEKHGIARENQGKIRRIVFGKNSLEKTAI